MWTAAGGTCGGVGVRPGGDLRRDERGWYHAGGARAWCGRHRRRGNVSAGRSAWSGTGSTRRTRGSVGGRGAVQGPSRARITSSVHDGAGAALVPIPPTRRSGDRPNCSAGRGEGSVPRPPGNAQPPASLEPTLTLSLSRPGRVVAGSVPDPTSCVVRAFQETSPGPSLGAVAGSWVGDHPGGGGLLSPASAGGWVVPSVVVGAPFLDSCVAITGS